MTVKKVSYWQCERFTIQDFIINFLKNIFTSVLAPQLAVAGLGMIRKGNNCNEIKVKKVESNVKVKV